MRTTAIPAPGADPSQHWYTISTARAIKALLSDIKPKMLLDAGSGEGVYARCLLEDGAVGQAVCVNENFEEWTGDRRSDRISYRRSVDQIDADAILLLEASDITLNDYATRAPAGSHFIISALALNAKVANSNEKKAHSLGKLTERAEHAGLEVIEAHYFFSALPPAASILRAVAENMKHGAADKKAPGWLNEMLIAWHDMERSMLFPFNRLGGAVAFCLAKKPAAEKKAAA